MHNYLDYFTSYALIILDECIGYSIRRRYIPLILDHLAHFEQMVFLSGPRQVGKTTIAEKVLEKFKYKKILNFDIYHHKEIILRGYEEVVNTLPIIEHLPFEERPVIVLDELHKYDKTWKNYLKGFDYTTCSKKLQVPVSTIINWIQTLYAFHYCFSITPWYENVTKSLRKEPKLYLLNWENVEDEGAKFENFIAVHLMKAVHFWNNSGISNLKFKLHYLRDTNKNEVDFLIVKGNKPWMMVETKLSTSSGMNNSLYHFHKQIRPTYSLQVIKNMDYQGRDISSLTNITMLSAKDFLSQLI